MERRSRLEIGGGMQKLINLEKLPPAVSAKIEPYLKALLSLYGDEVMSVVIYGSAIGNDFSAKSSDINLLVVFRKMDFSFFKRALKVIDKGIKRKISAPLFLTDEYILASLDVFPAEFLEIKENHITVFGEDLMGSIDINESNLRLECEQQLKGKLIRVRQAYLEVGFKAKGMEALLKESFKSLLPVFRNLLRLKGIKPPVAKEEIIVELCQEFDLNSELFFTILKDARNDERIAGRDVEEVLKDYLNQIEKLTKIIDKL
ncbi:MAG: hypothetical protein KAU12_03675 [Candidatus Omnitrophica bacterium]|nr:hypothetical protein [Candidatus Omnitrophota bacterium]